MAFIHSEIPKGAYKARWEAEFYRLKPRKRVAYDANKELRMGLRYLIWSRYSRRWYERTINEGTDPKQLGIVVTRGLVWIWPTEENKSDIRADVVKHGGKYEALMIKRQLEIDHEHHLLYANRQDGFQFKNKDYRERRYGK